LINQTEELKKKDISYVNSLLYSYEDIVNYFLNKKEFESTFEYLNKHLELLEEDNRTREIPYEYLLFGTMHRLNNDRELWKIYYQKSKDEYLEWMDNNASEYYPNTNLFRLSLIQDQPFDKAIEEDFLKRFKDDKERMIFYEARKILSNISFGKNYNLDDWMKKYKDTLFDTNWLHVNSWISQKEDFMIKSNLKRTVVLFKAHLDLKKEEQFYIDAIKKLEGKLDQNTEDYEKEKLASLYESLALLYLYQGTNNHGIYEFNKAISIIKTLININKIDLAIDYYELSKIYFIRKNYTKLMEVYQEIIRLLEDLDGQKNLYMIYYYVGSIHFQNNELDKALVAYNKAVSMNENDYKTYNIMGGIFLYRNDYKKAKFYFMKALEVNPNYKEALNNLNILKSKYSK